MKNVQLFLISSLVTVLAAEGTFKLTGSPQNNWEGNVMVLHGGGYLSLCDKGWNINTAHVICRELGFPDGALFIYYGTHFPLEGKLTDDRVWNCKGAEARTDDCINVTVSKDYDCRERVAGVLCKNQPSKSKPSVNCTFGNDTCGYKSNLTYGDILWQRTIGEIEDKATPRGHYMYLMSGRHGSGAKGQLKSPASIFGKTCLRFYYYMGTNRGALRVYIFTSRSYPKMVWSLEGKRKKEKKIWELAQVQLDLQSIELKQPSYVIFEGEVGIGAVNHIAVDDIIFDPSTQKCDLLPFQAKPRARDTSKSPCIQRTAKGKCCQPFTNDGTNYTSCIKQEEKGKKSLCLIRDKNDTKKIGCQDCPEKTIHGNCCFFPFKHDGVTLTSCKEDPDRRWCYTDKEQKFKETCRGVRLDGPPGTISGPVQVYHKGRWGTVCGDTTWEIEDARVVCRELGFEDVKKAVLLDNKIKKVVDRAVVWLQEVDCTGNEPMLSLCLHRGWGISNCPQDELAGVVCKAHLRPKITKPPTTVKMNTPGNVVTTVVPTDNSVELMIGECKKEKAFDKDVLQDVKNHLNKYCSKIEPKCKATVTLNGKPPKVRIIADGVSRETLKKSISGVHVLGGCKILKGWDWKKMLGYGGVALLAVLGVILYCLKRGKKVAESSKTMYTKVPSISEDSAEEQNGNSRTSDAEKGLLRQKEKKLNKLASKNC